MRCVVNIAPGATATHTRSPCRWIDMNVLDVGEIDDEAIVADSQATCVVASAANRNPQLLLPAEMNGSDYVGYVSAIRDQTRFATDHGIIDLARFFITRVGGLDKITAELIPELNNRFLFHGFLHFWADLADSIPHYGRAS
jgi:hypothetical protein